MTRTLGAVSLALACLAIVPAAFAESAPAKVFGFSEPNTVGQAPGYPSDDGLASLLTDVGAQGHRWVLDWKTIEPRAPQVGVHSFNFSSTDRLYEADLAHGVRPLIVLMNAPQWAWDPEVPDNAQPHGIPPGVDHLEDWGEFVAAAARRYPQALGFEVWNEPDAWGWTRGVLPVNPIAYTKVLASAYDAVKSTNPSIPVVGGAIATYPSTVTGVHMSVGDFVGGMLHAGAADHMDAISLHTYGGGPTPPRFTTYQTLVGWMRTALARGGVSMPIWITESGVSTTGSAAVTEQGQADTLVDLYRWFQSQPDVDALFIHSLFERWTDPSSREVGFGLIPQGGFGQPKAAFFALQQAVGRAPASPIAASPSGGPTTQTPSGASLDLEASIFPAQAVLRTGILRVLVDCHSPCSIQARGKLTTGTRGAKSTTYRLESVSLRSTDEATTIKLGLQRPRKAVGRANRATGRLSARVTVVATSPAGSEATRTLRADVKH